MCTFTSSNNYNLLKYFIFFRPDDPPEYNVLYFIPASVFFGGYTWGVMNSLPEIHNFAALGSSLCCIGAIASLSSQKTARFGNNLGIVSFFIVYKSNLLLPNSSFKLIIDWS